MKRFTLIYVWLLFLVLSVVAQEKVVKLKIVQTSDVHGNYLSLIHISEPTRH